MAQTLDNLSYTWNNAGTTFTGIKYNVTDTASAAGSLLMDLRVGGASKFKVDKTGTIVAASGSIRYSDATNAGTVTLTGNSVYFGYVGNGLQRMGMVTAGTFGMAAPTSFGWTGNNTNCSTGLDLALYRDADNTLAQRNGVNAQTSRIYGTYTDGSNYRRLTQAMSAGGVAEIKPEGAGTGASGNVLHISGLPTSNPGPGILWNDAGTVKVGT